MSLHRLHHCPEPGGNVAPLPMGACKQRWWGFGEYVSELYGSCLGRALLLLFIYVFFWDRSPSAARQALAPGASPENQVHLGSKSTPCEAGGVGSRMFPGPGTRQRLMEPPEGCYKRAGSRAQPPLGTAVAGAGGGWGEDVCSQPPQGGEHPF